MIIGTVGSTAVVVACGGLAGFGVWLALYSVVGGRPSRLERELVAIGAVPASALVRRPAVSLVVVAQGIGRFCRRRGLSRLLLVDDLALTDRDVDRHTATRLLYSLVAACGGLLVVVGMIAAGEPIPPLFAPLAVAAGLLVGAAYADRPVRRLAGIRRQEGALAVAAYIDLVRVLLVGGLPLHAALTAAADTGTGWTFGHLRTALGDARTDGVPPDQTLAALADRYPIGELRDLARTITAARRGGSPVLALEARADVIRADEAARARTDEAVADAQMELPSAVVAVAFVAYLTYPLLTLIGTRIPT